MLDFYDRYRNCLHKVTHKKRQTNAMLNESMSMSIQDRTDTRLTAIGSHFQIWKKKFHAVGCICVWKTTILYIFRLREQIELILISRMAVACFQCVRSPFNWWWWRCGLIDQNTNYYNFYLNFYSPVYPDWLTQRKIIWKRNNTSTTKKRRLRSERQRAQTNQLWCY